ncbi:site-specific recombinase XerD [Ureibacillus xyleni]|uniref:Site-specific recombinase XerD n=1 Tax=Ureibacillus xyleni TaxID=614648 RepID=A0A285TAE9_9BACL|nr:tyrosine-type recombinase/integrase [Ureibacillus xyleni]SOC16548.1 site-specific recombinase XerD [Ureibacillus xyleni]
MASITKRGKTYQYTISYVVDGKPKPIRKGGFRTKKEAQLAAAEIEAQLAKGVNLVQRSIPFNQYFERWIELYRAPKITNVTLKHYLYSLKAVKEHFPNTPIQNIKRDDYQKFLNTLGINKAKETVDKVHRHIKACVKDAVDDQIIPIDFTRNTKPTWSNSSKKSDEKHLDFDESAKLFNSLLEKLDEGLGYYLLLLGLSTGMRFEELVGLTRGDFDFDNNTININKSWGYKKDSPRGFGPLKNDQSERIVKVDQVTMKHFERLFETTRTNVHDLVFYSPISKYQVITNTAVNKLLKKLLIELDIEPITVHGLRHTHVSVLLYKKRSIEYISKRIGHSNVNITYERYTHLLKETRIEEEELSVAVFENMVENHV